MTLPDRRRLVDFGVLVLRWYLAYYMFTYGWSKLFGGQFHVKPEILEQRVKDVNTFYLAWYMFGLSKVFNIAVGLSQIIGALLIVVNRTAVVGTLFLLPVLVQILLIDVAFTMPMFGVALVIRLSMMLSSAFLILYYYRQRLIIAWDVLTGGSRTTLPYPWWLYIFLPLLGFAMDFVFGAIAIPFKILINRVLR
jgi:uncharacterized membrane protein YphA (DoxX/SURF4 family)